MASPEVTPSPEKPSRSRAPTQLDIASIPLSPLPEHLELFLSERCQLTDSQRSELFTQHYIKAVLDGNIDILTWIVRDDKCKPYVRLNETDSDGHSTLINAVALGHPECVHVLVEAGVDINQADTFGWTALHWAVRNNDLSLTSYLLNHRASPLEKSKKGLKPVDLVRRGIERIPIRQLLKGAEIVMDQERIEHESSSVGLSPDSTTSGTSTNLLSPSLSHSGQRLKKKPSAISLISNSNSSTNASLASSIAPSVLDQIEEEIKEREMKRRIDLAMKAYEDLDVDLSILGLGSRGLALKERGRGLSLEIEDQLAQTEFNWDTCTPDEMLVYYPEELPFLLTILISDMKPYRLRSERVIPVNAIFLCARYASYYCTHDMVEDLFLATLERIEDCIHDSPDNTQLCIFWLSNLLLLLYYMRRDPRVNAATSLPVEGADTVPQTLQAHVIDLVNDIIVFVIRNIERKVDRLIEPAILEYEPSPGQLDDIEFQGWAGSKFVKKLMGSAKKTVGHTRTATMRNLFGSYVSGLELTTASPHNGFLASAILGSPSGGGTGAGARVPDGSPVARSREATQMRQPDDARLSPPRKGTPSQASAPPSAPPSPTPHSKAPSAPLTPSRVNKALPQPPPTSPHAPRTPLSRPAPTRHTPGAYPGAPATPSSAASSAATITSLQNEYTPSTLRSAATPANHPQMQSAGAASAAEPTEQLLSVLSSTLFLFQVYEVAPAVIIQAFSQLFYWMGCELFNAVLGNKRYLCRSRALQILLNVGLVEDWVQRARLPIAVASRFFRPVNELLKWISCVSAETAVDGLIGTIQGLRTLNPLQLRRAARGYRYEVGEARLGEECDAYLEWLCERWLAERTEGGPGAPGDSPGPGPLDQALSGTQALARYTPPAPAESVGEMRDPKYMLPFVLPTHPAHAVVQDTEIFLFGQTVTLDTTVREMNSIVHGRMGHDTGSISPAPHFGEMLQAGWGKERGHARRGSVASVSSAASIGSSTSGVSGASGATGASLVSNTTGGPSNAPADSGEPLPIDIDESLFAPLLTADFFHALDISRMSYESGAAQHRETEMRHSPRRNSPRHKQAALSFTDLHGMGLGMIPFANFGAESTPAKEFRPPSATLSPYHSIKQLQQVQQAYDANHYEPRDYKPDTTWIFKVNLIRSDEDAFFDYTLPDVFSSEEDDLGDSATLDRQSVLQDVTNTYDDLTPRLPSAHGFVSV